MVRHLWSSKKYNLIYFSSCKKRGIYVILLEEISLASKLQYWCFVDGWSWNFNIELLNFTKNAFWRQIDTNSWVRTVPAIVINVSEWDLTSPWPRDHWLKSQRLHFSMAHDSWIIRKSIVNCSIIVHMTLIVDRSR